MWFTWIAFAWIAFYFTLCFMFFANLYSWALCLLEIIQCLCFYQMSNKWILDFINFFVFHFIFLKFLNNNQVLGFVLIVIQYFIFFLSLLVIRTFWKLNWLIDLFFMICIVIKIVCFNIIHYWSRRIYSLLI